MSLHIIILAAGRGTRMYSNLPKVLHPIGGKSMLGRVIETAGLLQPEKIHVVIGHQAEAIQRACIMYDVHWVYQENQQGTGHAVQQAMPFIPPQSEVLILSGDVPLIQPTLLRTLLNLSSSALRLLVATHENPTGLGRILRNSKDQLAAIVEEKDATPTERLIREVYTGICSAKAEKLTLWLSQLSNNNAQKEYYLTDIVKFAVAEHIEVATLKAQDPLGVQGINTRQDQALLERAFQKQQATLLFEAGVTLADPTRLDIRGTLACGTDCFIDINAVIIGEVTFGENCTIGPNCTLTNVTLGNHCRILPNSVLEGCVIGDFCEIGPFARIRPGTTLANSCKIGNFVEIKQATFDVGSKANHLSYLGDVTIGQHVNIGAGTITCNYDGANKHQTIIEDDAFIGSGTQLIAPITVGKLATIGAGTTLRRSAPPGELTLTSSKQQTIKGWVRKPKTKID